MFSLSVPAREFVAALKKLGKLVNARDATLAAFGYEDGRLTITVGGATVSVPATGEWTSPIEAPASFLLGLAKLPPTGAGDVSIRQDGGRLHIGNTSVPASVPPENVARIDLPLGTPLSGILALPLRYTADEIARSGLAGRLREAEEKRDAQLEKAADALMPLGVDVKQLRAWYDAWLQEKS